MRKLFFLLTLIIINFNITHGQSGNWYQQFFTGKRSLENEFRIFKQSADSLYTTEYVLTLISSNLFSGQEPNKIIGCAIGNFENDPRIYIFKRENSGKPEIKEIDVDSNALNFIRPDFLYIKQNFLNVVPWGSLLFDYPEDPVLRCVMGYSMLFRNIEENQWFYWVRIGGFDFDPQHIPPTQSIFLFTYRIIDQYLK